MPSIWADFRGHADQIAMFRRAAGRQRLAQAYLLTGPPGVGKRTFARRVTACLFCERHAEGELEACGACSACRLLAAGSHPDYFEIGLPEGKRELPLRLMIGEDEKRGREGLCHDLSLRPRSGRGRIAVVDDADAMSEEAANAFLKTLEEPPPGAVIFLIAPRPEALLPTIRSRCQAVRFAPLTEADVTDLLLATGVVTDAAAAGAAARDAEGSLETATRLTDPLLAELRRAVSEELARVPFDPGAAASRLIAAVEPAGDAAAQRGAAGWVARFSAAFFRTAMAAAVGARPATAGPESAVATRLSGGGSDTAGAVERLAELADRAAEVEGQLALNTGAALCLEAFAHDLATRLR